MLAQRTAEEAIREAKKDAEQLRSDAQQHFEEQIGKVEEDRRALEQQVEQLRAFEREYRTRLRAYLELQLRELDAPGSTQNQVEGGPAQPSIGAGGPADSSADQPGDAGQPQSSPFGATSPAAEGTAANAEGDGQGTPAENA